MPDNPTPSVPERLATIESNIVYIQRDLADIKDMLGTAYVPKVEFEARMAESEARSEPVRKIVYGATRIILTAVFIAMVALVVTSI